MFRFLPGGGGHLHRLPGEDIVPVLLDMADGGAENGLMLGPGGEQRNFVVKGDKLLDDQFAGIAPGIFLANSQLFFRSAVLRAMDWP